MCDANGTEITDTTHIGHLNPIRYRGYYYDKELGLYYLKSRYYDPTVGRFITQDDVDYADYEAIGGLNLYAYCNNNPVMHSDPTGHLGIVAILGIIAIVGAIVATANDIYQIASENVYVDMDKTNSTNVHIENSYKIITPWMRFAYAFYLNHFNPSTKDIIQGSTVGVQFEWALHNYAAWLGIGGDSAKHLDVGKTIFADGETHPLRDKHGKITSTGLMSLVMRVAYIIFHPVFWILDLIENGGF